MYVSLDLYFFKKISTLSYHIYTSMPSKFPCAPYKVPVDLQGKDNLSFPSVGVNVRVS